MRKERNRARLHPTREQGPAKKKRKVGENYEYITIKEVWGEPAKNPQVKHKLAEIEKETSSKRTRVQDKEHEIAREENNVVENNVVVEEVEVQDWDKEIKDH